MATLNIPEIEVAGVTPATTNKTSTISPSASVTGGTSTEMGALGLLPFSMSHPKQVLPGKEQPHSPAMSAISTHCGGASPYGSGPISSGGVPYRRSVLSETTRSLSNMSHLDLCPSPSATTVVKSRSMDEENGDGEAKEEPNPFRRRSAFHQAAANKQAAAELAATTSVVSIDFAQDVRRPKAKGEAQRVIPSGLHEIKNVVHEKAHKIFDEAHHFGLCEHYSKLLDQAKEIGFENVKWPTNFTLFHLAAKKNNLEFIDWLVRNDFDDLHTIDDFGKKPIDYACPRKRDSCFDVLRGMMERVTAPDSPAERKYQAIKAGTYVDPKKIEKQEKKKVNSMAVILQSEDIALGDVPAAKPTSFMTAYEAETVVPVEYKKCFKKLQNGGWSAMEGAWPSGGQTVLHWAARNGKEELCHFLILEYGADPHQEDGNGHDAMYHAKLKRHRKLAKKLLLKFKEPKTVKGNKK